MRDEDEKKIRRDSDKKRDEDEKRDEDKKKDKDDKNANMYFLRTYS